MTLIKILAIIAVVIAIVVLTPLAAIWSINTLFGSTIPYTFDTWCASLILSGVVSGQGLSFSSKK